MSTPRAITSITPSGSPIPMKYRGLSCGRNDAACRRLEHRRTVLGYLLEYHRREARQEWWQFFKRRDARVDELIEDNDCIGGLTVDTSVPPRPEKRSRVWTLRFPEQELKLGAGDKVVRADTGEALEIVSLDDRAFRLELKVGPSRDPLIDGISLIPPGPMNDTTQREAIVRYAEAVIAGRENDYAAITSMIRKDPPRLAERCSSCAETALRTCCQGRSTRSGEWTTRISSFRARPAPARHSRQRTRSSSC